MTVFASGNRPVWQSHKASDDKSIFLLCANYMSFFMLFPVYFVAYALSFHSVTTVVG
jgi:hypothetical protein